jgi:hypothetical protein
MGTAPMERSMTTNFRTSFEVQQYIHDTFPGVNTATAVPTKLRWVKRGKRIIREFIPLSQEEQQEVAPFIEEFRRLYYQPAESLDDEEVFGERMI